jgi:hypothetical protein
MKVTTPYPVQVEWTDASIDIHEDNPNTAIKEEDQEVQICVTVGFLLEVGRKNLVLAFETSPKGEEKTFRSIQRIPIPLVRKVLRLEPGKAVKCGRGK